MFRRQLHTELLRARGTSLVWLPLIAVPLVLLTYNLSRLASPATDATGVLMWQSMYVTGMAAPLVAMFAAAAEAREKRARFGGTHMRLAGLPKVQRTRFLNAERLARLLVVLLSIAVFHVINFGGSWLAVYSRENSSRILAVGVLCFVGSIGIAGLAAAVARLTNLVVTLVVFVIWQLFFALNPVVEADNWWMCPPAWPVRAVLPIMGIHRNSVPLEPGASLAAEKPWNALALCVLLALVGIAAALWAPDGWHPRLVRRSKVAANEPGVGWKPAVVKRDCAQRPWPFLALCFAATTPALVACMVLSAMLMVFTALLYPASYVHGLFVFGILPIGSGLAPVLGWAALRDSWPLMLLEYRGCRSTFIYWLISVVAVMSACSLLAGLIAGGVLGDELRRLVLSIAVGTIIALASLLFNARFGSTFTLTLSIVFAIISLTLGGDVLANTPLWTVAFSAWPETVTNIGRMTVAIPVVVVALASLCFCWQKKAPMVGSSDS